MVSNVTCSKCGAVYSVVYRKVSFRDQDSFQCNCGKTLDEWSSSIYPIYKLLK